MARLGSFSSVSDRLPASLLLLVGLLTGSCNRKDDNHPPPIQTEPQAEPKNAPAIADPSLESSQGQQVDTSPIRHIEALELRRRIQASGAKATIVNAWASWCGPCRREFPMLVSLRDSLASDGVEFFFVSVDETETELGAVDFAEQRGVKRPILVAKRPLDVFKQGMSPNWPGMLPATFLFDAEGELRYFWGGPVYENELLPIIEGFLKGKDIDGMARVGLRRGTDFRP